MKKGYYYLIALSMAIIMIAYSPIKSYAAGTNQSITNDIVTNKLRQVVTYNTEVNAETIVDAQVSSSVDLTFSVNTRLLKPQTTGEGPFWANGYSNTYFDIPMTFNAGINSTDWSFDYTVDYSSEPEGMNSCISYVRNTPSGNGIRFYYIAFFDNVFMPTSTETLCDAILNITIHCIIADNNVVPGITLGQGIFTNNNSSVSFSTNPDTTQGMARTISLAVERAIEYYYAGGELNIDIDTIISYLLAIKNTCQQYLPSILSELNNNSTLLTRIQLSIAGFDGDFLTYINILIDLIRQQMTEEASKESEMESEASQIQSRAEEMQSEMQSMEEAMEVSKPSIDGQLDQLESYIAQGDTDTTFYWLTGDTIIVTILVVCLMFGLIGYILHGNE